MSERTYTAKLKGKDIKMTNRQLAAFRDAYIGASELANRMSELLWLDIYILDAEFGVGPQNILSAITEVEQGEATPVGIKPATQFKNLPLKGLWHKHYFSPHFVPQNIKAALGKTGVQKLVDEVMDPSKPVITPEMIEELSHRVTHEPLEARDANKKLTGEWIIYVQHAGKNYYLCCNTHGAGDQFIYDRIVQHCARDFPGLMTWLKDAQGK